MYILWETLIRRSQTANFDHNTIKTCISANYFINIQLTMCEPRRRVLLRVHLGDVPAEHFVEYREEYRQQRVLQQWQPCRQVLRSAEVLQNVWPYRHDL